MLRNVYLVGIGVVFMMVGAGCKEKGQAIQFTYVRPPQFEMDPNVKALGIAEFGGTTEADKRWGDIASDRLADALDEYNKKFQRYQLVDRKRLKAILDERDLQAAFTDSSAAVEAGRIASVDAMIYGQVTVNARDEHGTRATFDPFTQSMKTVPKVTRYVMTSVNFTIDNVITGETLATVTVMKEYDSDEDKEAKGNSVARAMGFRHEDLPPNDQLTSHLIDLCVREFVMQISPHEFTVREELRGSKSEFVKRGNILAKAGDYAEALDAYQSALEVDPKDHGAAFNAGVVSEAMGQLDQAEDYYTQAFNLHAEEDYVIARKRVRQEAANGNNEDE
jgi:tetratricopeptide (TPR) repeat protein